MRGEWLIGDGTRGNDGSYVALGLKIWKAQIDRADKLFGSLSSEDVTAQQQRRKTMSQNL